MSNPGYLASFAEGSVAQDIAAQADAEVAAAQDGLRAPTIAIPLEDVLAEQDRFAGLAAAGHKGADALFKAYTRSELADRDAQVAYDLFRDAAQPAELAAHRFAVIDAEADFHLSDASIDRMVKNPPGGGVGTPKAPLQAAGVNKGASVALASNDVSTARGKVRTAHIGIKQNLVDVKSTLLQKKREASQEELDGIEAQIAQVAGVLDFFGTVSGKLSVASDLVGALAPDATNEQLGDAGKAAAGEAPGLAELALGPQMGKLRVEIAAQTKMIDGLASIDAKLELEKNAAEFADALQAYADAASALQAAVHERRQQYAEAGVLADEQLFGTAEEGQASQAMLVGSAVQESSVLLDAAIAEHEVASASVDTAQLAVEGREKTYYYRVDGGFASSGYEVETDHLAGDSDRAPLRKMAAVLASWGPRAQQAKQTLDAVAAEFEAKLVMASGATPVEISGGSDVGPAKTGVY